MVRIPTPSDSNHRGGQSAGPLGVFGSGRGSRGGPGVLRHLFRLGLLVVLVLMVMRGAANPKVYEPFFETEPERRLQGSQSLEGQGAEEEAFTGDRASSIAVSQDAGSQDTALSDGFLDAIDEEDRGAWMSWLASASDSEFQHLVGGIEHGDWGNRAVAEGKAPDLLAEKVQRSIDAWRSQDEATESPEIDRENETPSITRAGLLEGLRRDAMVRVIDGSVFRSSDSDALYDLISRSRDLRNRQGSSIVANVVALLQQPDFYRGKTIQVIGKVALVETIPAKDNPFGVDRFQQFWIQPDSGAERPIIVISPVMDGEESMVGQKILATGVYLKRLSYRSSIGADLAPVLVGNLARPTRKVVPRNDVAEPMAMAGIPVGIWLGGALLMGIGIAALIMVSSRRSAQRLQSIRNQMPATVVPWQSESVSQDSSVTQAPSVGDIHDE